MSSSHRVAFVLAATEIGPMIINRLDFHPRGDYSVGSLLLEHGNYEQIEADIGGAILAAMRVTRGAGVVAIDGGANYGALTLCWAKGMREWGTILAFEPQRHVYYALAGNLALNNIFNVSALHGAISDHVGTLEIPVFDYGKPFPSGSVSLLENPPQSVIELRKEAIGAEMVKVVTIDSLNLSRLDFLKLDIEGMEVAAIAGAKETIARCRPAIVAEHIICGQELIKESLPDYYDFVSSGMNTICIPKDDPILSHIKFIEPQQE